MGVFDLLPTSVLNWIVKTFAGDPRTCDHEWDVVCGILNDVAIQVQCGKCATWGSVPDPSKEEWDKCAGAYDNPYRWEYPERVEFIILDET